MSSFTDHRMEMLTLEQRVKLLDDAAVINEIKPILEKHLKHASMAGIVARMLTEDGFGSENISVSAHVKPYMKEEVIVIKIKR